MDSQRVEALAGVILTACVVLVTATFFLERLGPTGTESANTYVDDWESLLDRGVRLGSPQAPVQLVEFTDFQCPFCKQFHRGLDSVMAAMPGTVALTMLQFPLVDIHPESEWAAKAAICSQRQDAQDRMIRGLYENQKRLAEWTVKDLVMAVRIEDPSKFESCLTDDEVSRLIAEEKAIGQRIGVTGTPTVIIDGWLYRGGVNADSLARIVTALVQGRDPFARR